MIEGTVVSRRLAFLPAAAGKAYARKYVDGKSSLAEIAEASGLTPTRAEYAVKQYAVKAGFVSELTLNPASPEEVRAAAEASRAEGYPGWAWLAARTGFTPQKLSATAKAEAS